MDPKQIRISDYQYQLPEEKIAYYPLQERDASRLLVYRDGLISESNYNSIANELPPESLVLFNNTRVIEARILFKKSTGALIEIFCLEPDDQYGDITAAMMQQGKVYWKCLVGSASKWKSGQVLQKIIPGKQEDIILEARYVAKETEYFIIELSWSPVTLDFATVIHEAGAIPLPPYIKRAATASDKDRYQTVYARHDGSVAAPTAGLHFTETVLASLAVKNIQTAFLTLHVGAGTFKPVKAEKLADHEMHAEQIEIRSEFLEMLAGHRYKKIIATGTTTLRTLESIYWLGVKSILHTGISPEDMFLDQWEATELNQVTITVTASLDSLRNWMKTNKLEIFITKTQLLITPGYRIRMADALITNFHQPQSTLLLLVAAVVGDDWRRVYQYALDNNFRFLSYGDGSLLWVNAKQ